MTTTAARELSEFKDLHELISDRMQHYRVPGVAVGIIHNGAEQIATFGVTNVAHPQPVDADTLFQIGSTTKTVTGTTAMRLVEIGQLELDAPIRNYLPDFRLKDEDVAARVTLRHCFTHVGGWLGDYFDDTGRGDDAKAQYVARMVDLPQLTPLGAVWSYNNAGFSLAGRVIEVVAGKPYEQVVKELVLDPLGMTMSFFFPEDVMTHRFAVGHVLRGEEQTVAQPWALARSAHSAGALASSVKDQLRYARFHMGDGTAADGARVLKPETMQLMQSPQVARDLGLMGITWMLTETDGPSTSSEQAGRIVAHGGATNGQLSAFMLVPSRQFAITVLTNGNRGGELHRDVTNWALQHYVGITQPEPKPIEAPIEKLQEYVGRYTTALADTELKLEDDGLVMHVAPKGGFPSKDSRPPPAPPPMRVALCGDDQAIVLDEPMKDLRGDFLRNPDGSIAWFRFGGRIRARA